MKVLICGAGIAGLTLALRLLELGHKPMIVEQSGGLRGGGYMIDFFGSGFDAAEKLGLLPDLERIHYPIAGLAFVNRAGRVRYSLPYKALRKRLFDNRHFNFLRGDLEAVLYSRIEGRVPLRYGTTIGTIQAGSESVVAELSDGSSEECDLLVGADGVHSRVRSLAFGEESRFSRFLGLRTAAYILDSVPESLQETDAFDTLTVPRRQVAVYPIRGGRLATFFVYRAERPAGSVSKEASLTELRENYKDLDWIVPELLQKGSDVPSLFFDDVTQIEMPRWSLGRVTLLGDACQCVSLVAGQGASIAMAAAYVLAWELTAQDSVSEALSGYEERLKPAIRKKQEAGRKMAAWFAPKTSLGLLMRDIGTRMTLWPFLSRFVRNSMSGESIFQ